MTSLFASDDPAEATAFARVAVERGIDRYPEGLVYGIPDDLGDVEPGERVLVPLGSGNAPTAGYVVDVLRRPEVLPPKLKFLTRRAEGAGRVSPQMLQLARWISTYYCTPIGITLGAILPAAVKRSVGAVQRLFVDLGEPVPEGERTSPKQRAVLEALSALPEEQRPVDIRILAEAAGLKTNGPIKRLIERGSLTSHHKTQIEASWSAHAREERAPVTPTRAQAEVISALTSELDDGFSTHLLQGITGSGKTEVYIRIMQEVVSRGRVAIMLVPEIALTPQTGGRLLGRFSDDRVAILHSGLTAAQRHQQWALAASGTAPVILGARSAIFAPVPDEKLGLVIVDEEHDASYKQDQAPRYHGRDVAVRRAQLAGCPVLLGSATPSLESYHNAVDRRTYRLHRLTERAPGLSVPFVRVVDLAEERRKREDRGLHLLGPTLENAMARTLADGGQAILLLNRRGYANYIACADQRCGWVMTCEDCDVSMVFHKERALSAGGFVQCHHCQREQRRPKACPDCGRKVITFGLGTQRVEEELERKFPELEAGRNLVRVDSDTMRTTRDLHDVLDRFGRHEVRVLAGTQMIAKGLDFPGVRLVGVINADTALHMPDFRASERTFQLVSQVAGRCGRGEGIARVIVQSFNPDATAIVRAAAHDYDGFAREELDERQRRDLPPWSRMARLVCRDEDLARAVAAADRLALDLRHLAPSGVSVRGPAPCPITRIAGRHRQQIEITAPSPGSLQQLLAAARNHGVIKPGAKLAVDVDPLSLL